MSAARGLGAAYLRARAASAEPGRKRRPSRQRRSPRRRLPRSPAPRAATGSRSRSTINSSRSRARPAPAPACPALSLLLPSGLRVTPAHHPRPWPAPSQPLHRPTEHARATAVPAPARARARGPPGLSSLLAGPAHPLGPIPRRPPPGSPAHLPRKARTWPRPSGESAPASPCAAVCAARSYCAAGALGLACGALRCLQHPARRLREKPHLRRHPLFPRPSWPSIPCDVNDPLGLKWPAFETRLCCLPYTTTLDVWLPNLTLRPALFACLISLLSENFIVLPLETLEFHLVSTKPWVLGIELSGRACTQHA